MANLKTMNSAQTSIYYSNPQRSVVYSNELITPQAKSLTSYLTSNVPYLNLGFPHRVRRQTRATLSIYHIFIPITHTDPRYWTRAGDIVIRMAAVLHKRLCAVQGCLRKTALVDGNLPFVACREQLTMRPYVVAVCGCRHWSVRHWAPHEGPQTQ